MIRPLLSEYSKEVAIATDCYFTLKHINNSGFEDKSIFRGLDRNARSWNIICYSLQCSYFIAIGRIFDIDSQTFSIHKLIAQCIENVDIFGVEQLKNRKSISFNGDSNGLKQYIDHADNITAQHFQRLKGEIAKYQKIYEKKIRPIRHNHFAHKNFDLLHYTDNLFKDTQIIEIENIITFINQLDQHLFQLFHNGKIRDINNFSLNEEQHIKEDINEIMAKIRIA